MNKQIIVVTIAIFCVQILIGQVVNGYKKITTTIENHWSYSDTTITIKQYDENGKIIRDSFSSSYISISSPIHIDTLHYSKDSFSIKTFWQDNSFTLRKEVRTPKYIKHIAIDNEIDTIGSITTKLNKRGNPKSVLQIGKYDTIQYLFSGRHSIKEFEKMKSTIYKGITFIYYSKRIKMKKNNVIKVVDTNNRKNKKKIILNSEFQPTKIIARQYHPSFKTVFVNKYYYQYDDLGRLIQVTNIDQDGDLEMLKTIEYREL